jgi:hypothetical protein
MSWWHEEFAQFCDVSSFAYCMQASALLVETGRGPTVERFCNHNACTTKRPIVEFSGLSSYCRKHQRALHKGQKSTECRPCPQPEHCQVVQSLCKLQVSVQEWQRLKNEQPLSYFKGLQCQVVGCMSDDKAVHVGSPACRLHCRTTLRVLDANEQLCAICSRCGALKPESHFSDKARHCAMCAQKQREHKGSCVAPRRGLVQPGSCASEESVGAGDNPHNLPVVWQRLNTNDSNNSMDAQLAKVKRAPCPKHCSMDCAECDEVWYECQMGLAYPGAPCAQRCDGPVKSYVASGVRGPHKSLCCPKHRGIVVLLTKNRGKSRPSWWCKKCTTYHEAIAENDTWNTVCTYSRTQKQQSSTVAEKAGDSDCEIVEGAVAVSPTGAITHATSPKSEPLDAVAAQCDDGGASGGVTEMSCSESEAPDCMMGMEASDVGDSAEHDTVHEAMDLSEDEWEPAADVMGPLAVDIPTEQPLTEESLCINCKKMPLKDTWCLGGVCPACIGGGFKGLCILDVDTAVRCDAVLADGMGGFLMLYLRRPSCQRTIYLLLMLLLTR